MKTKPTLYVTLGFPGSGKTHFSMRLAKKIGSFHLSIDQLRHILFVKPKYTLDEHQHMVRAMDFMASALLSSGVDVIYDANLPKREYRNRLKKLAKKYKAKFLILYIQAPLSKAKERITTRHEKAPKHKKRYFPEISKNVLLRLKSQIEPPVKTEPVVYIDGTKPFKIQYEQLIKNS